MRKQIIIIPLLATTFIIAVLLTFISQNNRLNQTSGLTPTGMPSVMPSQTLKTFKSSNVMDFTVSYPSKFKVVDNIDEVDFNVNGDQISIVRNNTNYNTLDEYIKDFDSKRKLTVLDHSQLSIGGLDSVLRVVYFPEEKIKQKSYYIFVDSSAYIISTKVESLYSDLDQIAQSFRYTPN